ncbi:MAG TPA: hypothetical protein VF950_20115 [Planctomycetota bacterium]
MNLTPLREPRVLRERVDAKLGAGTGMSLAEARDLLSPAERVEWALGECLFAMKDRRFHIWVQGWCLEGPVDGPAVIAAIAEAARPVDGVVADLLRWTANRGVWARTGERPEALFNVVPEVWLGAWEKVVPFVHAVASCWPEDVDPFALPAPPPWTRATSQKKIRMDFPSLTAEGILESAAHALWAGGASEDDLDAFFREAGEDLLASVVKRIQLDAKEVEAIKLALHPPDVLALALGLEKLTYPSLLLVKPEREAEILALAERYNHAVVRPPFAEGARRALRMDPDLVIGWTRDLLPGDVEIVTTILQTGHAVLLFGTKDALSGIPESYFSTS